MINDVFHVFKQAIMISGFVFVMMLVIEYINVQTNGIWQKNISANKWKQYVFAAFLGVIPGCLGAFTAVALFSHRLISFGAIVTAMIATSGDEAFVMFAMFPQKALLLTLILFIIGVFAGYITDKIPFSKKLLDKFSENEFPLHTEEQCICFQRDKLLQYLFKPSIFRLIITIIVLFLLIAVSTGIIAGDSEIWMKITILILISFSLFVVITVPEHFLKEHLWDHIVKKHLLRIFLWTFGTLLAFHFLIDFIDIQSWITDNLLIVLLIAVLVGIIPESGPHLIFVTLFVQGAIPFSILIASSIAQDGHGMLPLLAESKRGFLAVKFVNIIFALVAGIIGYLLNF
ncbi:MAG: putative manganese transporter [Saprospiraceae bacterium]|nr:putative manganese transporter [Saprospiraceae bacterium]